ncbi:MAG: hypothetical protein RIS84_487 [Pseudomonadota bacterium]|jgi:hypothetical protein
MGRKQDFTDKLFARIEKNPNIRNKIGAAVENKVDTVLHNMPTREIHVHIHKAGSKDKFLHDLIVEVLENVLSGIIMSALKGQLLSTGKANQILGTSSALGVDHRLANSNVDDLLDSDLLYPHMLAAIDNISDVSVNSLTTDRLFTSMLNIPVLPDIDYSDYSSDFSDFMDVDSLDFDDSDFDGSDNGEWIVDLFSAMFSD